MEASLFVTPPEWLKSPNLRRLMHVLGDKEARLVGGCVRAAVLGDAAFKTAVLQGGGQQGLIDIDIATKLRPQEVMERASQAGFKVVPTGIEYGTVTVVVQAGGKAEMVGDVFGKNAKPEQFEVTTLRRDISTDGRRAKVVYSQSWMEDAMRRDFTMNTLLMDLEGNVYDPTGRGVSDLRAGRVVFVGDADERIAEDYLRILRFFRFHARFGIGAPDPVGFEACLRSKFHITKLSRERIGQEYEKLLSAKRAADVLELIKLYDILPDVVSPDFNPKMYRGVQLAAMFRPDLFGIKLLFAHSVWRNKPNTNYSFLAKYFCLSKSYKRYFDGLFRGMANPYDSYVKNAYMYGKDIALACELLLFLNKDLEVDVEQFLMGAGRLEAQAIPEFPVRGDEVARITGLQPGVELGQVLRRLESVWFDGGMVLGKEALLKMVNEEFI